MPQGDLPPASSALAHELLVDAFGCPSKALANADAVRATCDEIVLALGVVVLGEARWHRFADTPAGPGGVTGLYLLSESHLAVHTWPERGALLLSLCCCRPLVDDDVVRAALARHLGATRLQLRRVARGAGEGP